MIHVILNPGSTYARPASPILVEQARGLVSKSPTLLLTDDSLSVKKAWVTLCLLLLINSRFETKPMHGFIHFGL